MSDERRSVVGRWAGLVSFEQTHPTVVIDGSMYPRVRYGADFPASPAQCGDCTAMHGLVHVFGCVVELCPRCRTQAIACGCVVSFDHLYGNRP